MAHIHLVPQYIGKDHLGEVLFLLVPVQIPIFELLSDVRHLAVDPLLLELAHTTCSDVGDVLLVSARAQGRAGGREVRRTGGRDEEVWPRC